MTKASTSDTRRLFFGAQVEAPWPTDLPTGRLVAEGGRHLTLAFLGDTVWSALEGKLSSLPQPSFQVGPVGFFKECLFLPPRHPRVVAWEVEWLANPSLLLTFQGELAMWLRKEGYPVDEREFLSHITIARQPFHEREWRQAFHTLPVAIMGLHLYESTGNLVYSPVWSWKMAPPFHEIEHTADVAFVIRGESMAQLQLHAQIALSFKFPPLLAYFDRLSTGSTLPEIVVQLNELIAFADAEQGCPFKAVSFCGDLEEENGVFLWEMIVDV